MMASVSEIHNPPSASASDTELGNTRQRKNWTGYFWGVQFWFCGNQCIEDLYSEFE